MKYTTVFTDSFLLNNHNNFIRLIYRNNAEANLESYQHLRGLVIYFCDNFCPVKFASPNLKHTHSCCFNNSEHRTNTEQYFVQSFQVNVIVCVAPYDTMVTTSVMKTHWFFSKVFGSYIPHGHTSIISHIYIILYWGKYVNTYARRRLQDGIHNNTACKTT